MKMFFDYKWWRRVGRWISKASPVAVVLGGVGVSFTVSIFIGRAHWLLSTGLILQIMGTICVIPSLYGRLVKGKDNGISGMVAEWVKSFPRPNQRYADSSSIPITATVSGSDVGISAEAATVVTLNTMDERVKHLEERLNYLVTDLTSHHRGISEELDRVMAVMSEGNSALEKRLDGLEIDLKALDKDGLKHEIVGVIWLISGLFIASLYTIWL